MYLDIVLNNMKRRFILLTGVGAITIFPGCNILDDQSDLEFNYSNQRDEEETVYVTLHGNDGVHLEESYNLQAGDEYSEEKEIDETGPFLLEVSLEGPSRSDYEYTIEENSVIVEIILSEEAIEFESD